MPSVPRICVVLTLAAAFTAAAIKLGRHFLLRHADRIDTHRTRIPLVLATFATVLFCSCGTIYGIGFIVECVMAREFWPRGLLGAIAAVPLAVVLLSYWLSIRLIRRKLQWMVCDDHRLEQVIAKLCEEMGLSHRPALMLSGVVQLPLVVGRREESSFLVIPESWVTPRTADVGEGVLSSARAFQVYHELAHLRNRDVRFTTWAYAVVRALLPVVAITPVLAVVVIFGVRMEVGRALTIVGLPLLGYGVLWVLYHVVLRQRELDADARAASVAGWKPSTVTKLLEDVDPTLEIWSTSSPGKRKKSWRWQLEIWLADKAVFGSHRGLWRTVAKLAGYGLSTHPSVLERQENIQNRKPRRPWSVPSVGMAVWTGVLAELFVLGLLSSMASLVLAIPEGLLGSREFLATQIALPFWDLANVTVLSTCIAFIALSPSRFSDEAGLMTLVYVFRLGKWFLMVSASAMGVLLMAQLFVTETLRSTMMAIAVSYVGSIALASISRPLRGMRTGPSRSWYPTAGILLGCLAIAGLAHVLAPGVFFPAGIGLLAGAIILSGYREETSIEEGYAVRSMLGKMRQIEGKEFRKWGPLACCILDVPVYILPCVLCGALMAVVYCLCRGEDLQEPLGRSEWAVGLAALGVAIILGMVYIAVKHRSFLPGRLKGIGTCVEVLSDHCPCALAEHRADLRRLVEAVGAEETWVGEVHVRSLRTQEYILPCLKAGGFHKELVENLAGRVMDCECQGGGFGVWPCASARLSSTYSGLCILADLGRLDEIDCDAHLRWLGKLRDGEGLYSDPLLKSPFWKQTYWGMRCAQWLGAASAGLSGAARSRLMAILRNGLTQERLSEEMLMALWCLNVVGADDSGIAHEVAGYCAMRAHRLSEMRTSWVLDEYAALSRMTQISPEVARRVSPLLAAAEERIEGVLIALLRGMDGGPAKAGAEAM